VIDIPVNRTPEWNSRTTPGPRRTVWNL